MREQEVAEFRQLALSKHESDWRMAAIIVGNVVVLRRGQQPVPPQMSADEFARLVDVRGWSRKTIVRWWRAWQIASYEGIVSDPKQITRSPYREAAKVAKEHNFEDYLAEAIKLEREPSKSKPDKPLTDYREVAQWVGRFERVVANFQMESSEQANTALNAWFNRLIDEATGQRVVQFPPDKESELADRIRAVAQQMVNIARGFGATVEDADLPTGTTWATAMFAALPKLLHTPSYKALSQVLHPDHGGDEEAMKNLNDAYDRRSK